MRRRWIAIAACIALAATLMPLAPVAHAVEDAEIERFDPEKFWAYAGCAASIAVAAGTGGWFMVAIACGKAATTYWTT